MSSAQNLQPSTTPEAPNPAAISAKTAPNQTAISAKAAPNPPPPPQSSDKRHPAEKTEIEKVTLNFNKKIADLQDEFKRQMHAIQSLVCNHNAQIQSTVNDIRTEMRRTEQSAMPMPASTDIQSQPLRNSTESLPASQQSASHRQKKIYPLPKFSGSPEEWQTFEESFESTTLEFEYSPLHNIMRLRDAITGGAREAVESLLCSSRNVDAIMAALKETYGRPEQLIKSQIQKVKALNSIAEGDLAALIEFANKISNMATFLESARGEHHLTNPTLLSELVAKLPISRQIQWAEKCLLMATSPTILDFRQWLGGLRRIANLVADSLPSTSAPAITNHPGTRKHPSHPSTADNKARKYAFVSVAPTKCRICDGECKNISGCESFLKLSIDDRWNKVKSLRVCFCCLKNGHQASKCFSKRKCDTDGCPRFHHRLLHSATTNSDQPTTSAAAKEHATGQERRSCHADANREDDAVLFQMIPVQIYGNKMVKQIYALVDDGSNATMLDAEVARELQLQGPEEVLELQWLNKKTACEKSQVIELSISGVEENAKQYKMSKVFVTSNLALPTQSMNINNLTLTHSHLSGIPTSSYRNIQPKMIISLTHAFLTVPIEIPRSSPCPGPIATRTRLGWMVYGPIGGEVQTNKKIACHARNVSCSSTVDSNLEILMRSYFDMETFGTNPNVKTIRSDADEKAMSILNSTTRRVENRYEAGLLWRQDDISLPDSFQMCVNRLESIEKKMKRDPEYASEYCTKIHEYVQKGYARKMTAEEASQRTSKTFYLPHFAVKNPNKKGLRLVFDAAAEIENISLNKVLLPGPDINQSLLSILFKFRQAPIAVCGDIKEMFHQVQIMKEDQDSQRFLWRDGNSTKPPNTYVMQRLIFGATCSPTIAQFVKNTNAQRYAAQYPRAVKAILERHYVDDYVDSFQTEKEAIQVVKAVIKIHAAGGFIIRNFVSNSEKLKREVGNSATNEEVSVEGSDVERILGMHWLSKTDVFMFIFKFNKVPDEIIKFKRKPTKRETLSVTMSIFDPFGLLANFTVCAKIIMQSIWKTGIDWDEELPDGIYGLWKNWLEELYQVQNFRISRCYFTGFEKSKVELHVFCDASEQALAAVAYWRYVEENRAKLSFVAGKTSCAPTRFHSIPKLELQAAVLAVRLKDTIVKCHEAQIGKIVFWSDSNTVIQWIRSDHRIYKQYVANRVSEILEGTKIKDWRWCPGGLNPADDATRAVFPMRYNAESRWKLGPNFLLSAENEWPTEPNMKGENDKSADELKSKHFVFLSRQVSMIIPRINRFSSYSRLKRSMAWVLRYVANLKRKAKGEDLFHGELTSEEEAEAEMYMWRCVQRDAFQSEYACLLDGKAISKCSSIITLNPYLQEDVIRVGGRIDNATFISISARRPIILPKDHHVTRLLVNWYHRKLRHINTSTVINEIRQRYWIPSIRTLVRSIEASCTFCKVRKAKPQPPQMGLLPPDRVTPFVRPFAYTGLDYFGPITVTTGRRNEKIWVALFTCLTVRAVHLEIATDLSSDACIVCIRNFINRRGVPIQIRSDNGTNFVGINKELHGVKDFLDPDKMQIGLAPLGIKWKFNTPSNPSAGGVWERLVQSIKKPLYIMLKEYKPRMMTLQCLLIEAENIVNSRPLTHLPVTPDDPEPLTPNHFLLGSVNSTQTPAPFEPRLLCLRKQWRVLQALKNGFWKQWIREYLPELTRRTKWCLPVRPMAVGSLVLICDENASRSQWLRGRIINLYYGKDEVARSAEIRTSGGTLKRPVSKLALLDVVLFPYPEVMLK